ncbi:MAG TPA: hypothetical protein VJW51_10850 [Candidatus Acidoferrales bacterium]|nr:hypothetical protein [Candidatus Acidoferrales bacterium]
MGLDEAGRGQHIQMKGEGRAGKAQLARDLPRGKAQRGVPHQKAEDIQARFLSEGGERIHGLRYIHISRTMEIYANASQMSNNF